MKYTTGKYILNCGQDNIIPKNSLKKLLYDLKKRAATAVGGITRVVGNNYLSWCLNRYRTIRFTSGFRKVIGTPTLFIGDVLRKNSFNKKHSYSDDAELCERLKKKINSIFYVSNTRIYESGTSNLKSVILRWKIYGISDYEIFLKNKNIWSAKRKIESILYPFNQEFLIPFMSIKKLKDIKIIPFLLFIVTTRYFSWILKIIKLI